MSCPVTAAKRRAIADQNEARGARDRARRGARRRAAHGAIAISDDAVRFLTLYNNKRLIELRARLAARRAVLLRGLGVAAPRERPRDDRPGGVDNTARDVRLLHQFLVHRLRERGLADRITLMALPRLPDGFARELAAVHLAGAIMAQKVRASIEHFGEVHIATMRSAMRGNLGLTTAGYNAAAVVACIHLRRGRGGPARDGAYLAELFAARMFASKPGRSKSSAAFIQVLGRSGSPTTCICGRDGALPPARTWPHAFGNWLCVDGWTLVDCCCNRNSPFPLPPSTAEFSEWI